MFKLLKNKDTGFDAYNLIILDLELELELLIKT